ncbi:Two-component sensor histidine kinase, contains HisKA and HATPase domains [Roseivivax lentus]|uniref:Two-component sensor histidine kinase, contains HisKA and HATPase domains n=1 Tax=Roseivivax lentus TaxID=633194 RepID=A0A1N7LY53_9RHOB|nr:histidine kinase dimerization/phosphoacceptor domain -containing protein [Roseivivax lentus]SIS78722.1 Two-component sensor histidine kinase, contains HisKA and HATPase domains [Roseivivax lentus]
MRAPTPSDQAKRLEDLRDYDILDSEPSEAFQSVVDLVKEICDVPVALISFVDEDRQWFKAYSGIEVTETPLENAVCGHTILQDEVLEIPDTCADARTRDNELCISDSAPMRFYAGAPLISQRGYGLGSLCVLDSQPRRLTEHQRKALKLLAGQVMQLLELHKSLRNEEILRNEIDHRVKNSLQTVSSFIRIYSARSHAAETKEALSAIGRRVNAIAQLHAELYNTNQLSEIRLDQYLMRVIDLLRPQMASNVSINTSFRPIKTESRQASQIAMIVSEFAANASKHAFPDGRDGIISFFMEPQDDGTMLLLCEDNGIGDQATTLPSDENEIASIGMRLMESAAEQIGGRLKMGPTPEGFRLELVTFPQTDDAPFKAGALSAE